MSIKLSGMRLFRFEGPTPDARYQDEYRKTFELWWNVWSSYYDTLPTRPELNSDPFTRQDEIYSFFVGSSCVGVWFCRFVNFSLIDHAKDSYFRLWRDPELIKKLTLAGSEICVVSFLTINDEFRGSRLPFSLKRLMAGTSIRRLHESNAHAMPVTARNAKGVNDMFYSLGGVCLKNDVPNFHPADLVDLVVLYRNRAQVPKDFISIELLDEVWGSRILVPRDESMRSAPPIRKAA